MSRFTLNYSNRLRLCSCLEETTLRNVTKRLVSKHTVSWKSYELQYLLSTFLCFDEYFSINQKCFLFICAHEPTLNGIVLPFFQVLFILK